MIHPGHFRALVVRPTLEALGLHSPAAENLLIGTALQESGLRWLRQLGEGPALGLYQMEPATCRDIWQNYLAFHRDLAQRVSRLGDREELGHLVTRLDYATAMARVHYLRRPEPLPDAGDIEGLARYWKGYYNTAQGRGTVGAFILKYRQFAG